MPRKLKSCGNCIHQIEHCWPSFAYCGHTNPTWGPWNGSAKEYFLDYSRSSNRWIGTNSSPEQHGWNRWLWRWWWVISRITLKDRIRRHRKNHPNDLQSFENHSSESQPFDKPQKNEDKNSSGKINRSPCKHRGPNDRTRWCSTCQANVCRLCELTGGCHGVRARRVRPGQLYPDDPGHRLEQDSGSGMI